MLIPIFINSKSFKGGGLSDKDATKLLKYIIIFIIILILAGLYQTGTIFPIRHKIGDVFVNDSYKDHNPFFVRDIEYLIVVDIKKNEEGTYYTKSRKYKYNPTTRNVIDDGYDYTMSFYLNKWRDKISGDEIPVNIRNIIYDK